MTAALQQSLFLSLLIVFTNGSQTCDVVTTELGFVCKCNSSYCDIFPEIPDPENENTVFHLFTGKNLPGFNLVTLQEPKSSLENAIEITVNTSHIKNPNLIGFGGSFTDAFGYNLRKLSPQTQKMLLKSYFSSEGIKYSLCRMAIGSNDFSLRYYDYDPTENDENLEDFSLTAEDYDYRISVIRDINKLKSERDLKLFGIIWAPPPWMKINNSTFAGYLKDNYYQLYADYLVRLLTEYRSNEVEFWGISGVNEPLVGLYYHFPINNLIMTPEQQRNWISENFGPTLESNGFENLKLITMEDQRTFMNWWMDIIKEDDLAYNFTSGIGIHWYLDRLTPTETLDLFHKNHPDKFILYTESSLALKNVTTHGPGSWKSGIKYGNSVIQTLNHYSSGWVDWNMALDREGGPNNLELFSESPIIVNAEKDEFYKQPMFYVLGHFSTLSEPGAQVLGVKEKAKRKERTKRKPPKFPKPIVIIPLPKKDVIATAVSNPDGRIVVFILNMYSTLKNITIEIYGKESNKRIVDLVLSASSMNSIVFPCD